MWKNMCSFDFSHKETSWNSQDTHKKPPLFFPAQERKPSPSVWTRLQFPHSKVFNLTKCHLHQLCHDSYTATYSLWLLVLKKKKNQLNTHSPPSFLQHTSHVCGDDSIMHIACCTSVITCFTGSTNQAVTQQHDRKDSKISPSVPTTAPHFHFWKNILFHI